MASSGQRVVPAHVVSLVDRAADLTPAVALANAAVIFKHTEQRVLLAEEEEGEAELMFPGQREREFSGAVPVFLGHAAVVLLIATQVGQGQAQDILQRTLLPTKLLPVEIFFPPDEPANDHAFLELIIANLRDVPFSARNSAVWDRKDRELTLLAPVELFTGFRPATRSTRLTLKVDRGNPPPFKETVQVVRQSIVAAPTHHGYYLQIPTAPFLLYDLFSRLAHYQEREDAHGDRRPFEFFFIFALMRANEEKQEEDHVGLFEDKDFTALYHALPELSPNVVRPDNEDVEERGLFRGEPCRQSWRRICEVVPGALHAEAQARWHLIQPVTQARRGDNRSEVDWSHVYRWYFEEALALLRAPLRAEEHKRPAHAQHSLAKSASFSPYEPARMREKDLER
ncbi:hypothetical protein JCM10213_004414 [Rhodosporidiobolus nylandii]